MQSVLHHIFKYLLFFIAIGNIKLFSLEDTRFYENPIINADYSDPDVIRVGSNYYLVSSSFNQVPGIPVLYSTDLVNWKIINHVIKEYPFEKYNKPAYGQGAWAPSIRYHNNTFYVYFCTPYDGLFVAQSNDPKGEWNLTQIIDVELWEDPCPFWDDDGNAYLIRSKLGGGQLILHRMNQSGDKLLDSGTIVFENSNYSHLEGPKLYKLNGYYYIFAPAGGVQHGYQTVLRSNSIFGPYEAKVVLHQGSTDINGPHQGALVQHSEGSFWFIHYQWKPIGGRIVHLQPVRWVNDWPTIGIDQNNDMVGEPVERFLLPESSIKQNPKDFLKREYFCDQKIGNDWQWNGNPKMTWYSLTDNPGFLRLFPQKNLTQNGNVRYAPNTLSRKLNSESFQSTVSIRAHFEDENERYGIVILSDPWYYMCVELVSGIPKLLLYEGTLDIQNNRTQVLFESPFYGDVAYMRMKKENDSFELSYSENGDSFNSIHMTDEVKPIPNSWIGVKYGLLATHSNLEHAMGYADIEWIEILNYQNNEN